MQPRKASTRSEGAALVRASSSSTDAGAALGHCPSTRTASLTNSGSCSRAAACAASRAAGVPSSASTGSTWRRSATGIGRMASSNGTRSLVLVLAGPADGVKRLQGRLAVSLGAGLGGNIQQRYERVRNCKLAQRVQRGKARRFGRRRGVLQQHVGGLRVSAFAQCAQQLGLLLRRGLGNLLEQSCRAPPARARAPALRARPRARHASPPAAALASAGIVEASPKSASASQRGDADRWVRALGGEADGGQHIHAQLELGIQHRQLATRRQGGPLAHAGLSRLRHRSVRAPLSARRLEAARSVPTRAWLTSVGALPGIRQDQTAPRGDADAVRVLGNK